MSRTLRFVLPFLIVAVSVAAAYGLYASRPKAEPRTPDPVLPVVRIHSVQLKSVQLTVRSQGTVVPRTESALVSEVAGRVVEVAPSFAPGGFFEAGDWLIRIDTHDYRQQLVQAQASESQARLRLARIEAEAALAKREWEALGEGKPTALTLFEPQLAEAQASLEAALAFVAQAQRNLDRTTIRAPYAGRVRTSPLLM